MDLISIYYDISEIFNDEIEITLDAILKLTDTKYKRNALRVKLDSLCLNTIESELNQLYSMQHKTLKKFYIDSQSTGKQLTIFDFIGEY